MSASPELFVERPDGVRLCYQTFGSPSDPAVLLLPGGGQSMLSWPEGLIRLLLDGGKRPHYVVRYDPRDTGR